jgi:hypothetical protein
MRIEARRLAVALVALAIASGVTLAAAGAVGASAPAANTLVRLMESKGLEAVAVADPSEPDKFVAALLVPDVQLLVVAAKSKAPDYVRDQLRQHQYRDAYATLFSGAVQESKLFFHDMGCDGLNVPGSGNTDVLYERGVAQTIFDGDWKGQKLSKTEYEEKLRKADAEYGRLLLLLAAGVEAGG